MSNLLKPLIKEASVKSLKQGNKESTMVLRLILAEFQKEEISQGSDLNNNDEVSFDTSIYVFCAVGVRSAIAGYNLKIVGYENVFNLVGFQDILDQGGETSP